MQLLQKQLEKHCQSLPEKAKMLVCDWINHAQNGGMYGNPKSQKTVELYVYNGVHLLKHIQKENCSDLPEACAAAFNSCSKKEDTKRRHIYDAAIAFAKYLLFYGLIAQETIDRLKQIKPKRRKKKLEKPFTYGDFKKLIDRNSTNTGNSIFDKILTECLLIFLANTGLRRQELCDLLAGDIDKDNNVILVREPKNGEDRFVPLNSAARAALDKYLKIKPESDSENLFLQSNGMPLKAKSLYQRIKRLADSVGVNITVHSFRKFCCNHLIEVEGLSLPVVQRVLGHKDYKSTLDCYYNASKFETAKRVAQLDGFNINGGQIYA